MKNRYIVLQSRFRFILCLVIVSMAFISCSAGHDGEAFFDVEKSVNLSIKGVVKNEDGRSLEKVKITLKEARGKSVYTESNGSYEHLFIVPPLNSYTIIFEDSEKKYEPVEETITVTVDERKQIMRKEDYKGDLFYDMGTVVLKLKEKK